MKINWKGFCRDWTPSMIRTRATIVLVPIVNDSASAMSLMERLEEKRDDILKIAFQHGAFNVRVFGSVVRKEETEASDIDFLIDYDSTKTSPWFPGGLLMDLQDLLGCKVDIVTEQGLSPFIREQVLNEAKPL